MIKHDAPRRLRRNQLAPWRCQRRPVFLALSLNAVLSACPAQGQLLLVDTAAHSLTLCANGQAAHRYDVAIGSGGAVPIEKRIGWAVTPLGHFTLTDPRPSSQFHLFIGLQNPVPKRFSAWAIGLHGPPRESRDAGHSNVESDWTWGCISVSSDPEIDEISSWVRENKVRAVEFR